MAENLLLVINIGLGAVFLFHGVILTAIPLLTGAWRRLPAVPAFGLGQLMFGVGELSRLPLVRSAAPLPDPAWEYLSVFTTYFMIVPLYLFNTFFFGPGCGAPTSACGGSRPRSPWSRWRPGQRWENRPCCLTRTSRRRCSTWC